ncbi:hypothetical protein EOD42_24895 [Rhodovarius crocodyli]|uniref:EAL domain-containing protein n=1 Tax=Rhodovarius crocodyli TaxID=1979269 RepID=A0A437LW65_9PROT|nr:hypothetical protein [Rhodovarius crocodyli]RVT89638.1 hypothetical protein EOD42_24895 [Rhodovarius crocodyli]
MNAMLPPPANAQKDTLALTALARESVASGVERRVLHLRLSALPAQLNHTHHQRQLREALLPLLRPTRARLYDLPNGDLVAVSPPPAEHLETVRATMLKLLGDDPAAANCCQELRLPAQAAALLAAVEGGLGLAPPAPAERTWMQRPAHPPGRPAPGQPPRAEDVLAAEAALAPADLSVHQRWQAVCLLKDGHPEPREEWREQRLSEEALLEALLPGTPLAGVPWLRRRLRSRMARRTLAQWARPDEVVGFTPRGLALLPANLLQDEFLRLDAMLGSNRAMLTIGFTLTDILADPEAFGMALRFAGLRGYRTALTELAPEELPLVPPDLFGLTLLKLRFAPGLLELDATGRAALEAALPSDRSRIVLSGVDSAVAISWGWQRGIERFQGRLIEQRLSLG